MFSERQVEALLSAFTTWAQESSRIEALALVGSWARGEAGHESDLDIVIVTSAPELYRSSSAWVQEIEWETAQFRVTEWREADYGAVWSRHLVLDPFGQVELSFADPSWAKTDPIDSGTERVVRGGFDILFDAKSVLAELENTVSG